jgi:hypothetical protein
MEENTNKLFRLVVNFVYDELLNQFIKNYGDCKSSTFCLINWDVLVNNRNSGNFSFCLLNYEVDITSYFYLRYLWKIRDENRLQMLCFIFSEFILKIFNHWRINISFGDSKNPL